VLASALMFAAVSALGGSSSYGRRYDQNCSLTPRVAASQRRESTSMKTFPPAQGFRSTKRNHHIVVVDGPNMSNLGARNKRVYGSIASLDDLQGFCKAFGAALSVQVTTFASNFEGAILEFIHESAKSADAYVINPAGLTEGGVATKHALTETGKPYIEVHFANIVAPPTAPRGLPIGPWHSTFSPSALGVMMGMREYSYAAAILSLAMALDDENFIGGELPKDEANDSGRAS
jgi:3-dehydroquinate dehydratase II